MAAAQAKARSPSDPPDASLVGAHCSFEFCRQLDLLPFACPSCHGVFCRNHRIESDHQCAHAGAWAASRRERELMRPSVGASAAAAAPSSPPGPCAAPGCQVIVRKPLSPATACSRCRCDFCLTHRLFEDHNCQPPQPPSDGSNRARASATLNRLRAWATATAATRKPAAVRKLAPTLLQSSSRGDHRVPLAQRVYVHVEASGSPGLGAPTAVARADLFFHAGWTVGRVLDVAAREMDVDNVNNTTADEVNRLRIFHVERGRVLHFTDLFGHAVDTGDTIVLLRGVSAPPPPPA